MLTTILSLPSVIIIDILSSLPAEVYLVVLLFIHKVHNGSLMDQLQQHMAPCRVYLMDEQGINSKAFEAVAFAVLAYQTVHGVATNVPSVTGAQHPVVLGTISPGRYVPSFH